MCTDRPNSNAKALFPVRSFAACTNSKYWDIGTRLSPSRSRSGEIRDRCSSASRPAPLVAANSTTLLALPADTVASTMRSANGVTGDHDCDSWGHGRLPGRLSLYSARAISNRPELDHPPEERDMSTVITREPTPIRSRLGPTVDRVGLPVYRLNLMRVGYLVMGVGLAFVKWPLLFGAARSLPVFEGVVACLLTAVSLLAFLGLRHPVAMLPVLLFETGWKAIWFATVALPHLVAGDIDAATTMVLLNCSVVVVIAAVTPWDYAWKRYVATRGDAWRR
jgi:hypothetical protein